MKASALRVQHAIGHLGHWLEALGPLGDSGGNDLGRASGGWGFSGFAVFASTFLHIG